MERRQLEHFLAVIDRGSMSEAARSCGVSQPGLSQSVSSLEKDLGVLLFRREPRRVTLTLAGHALADAARDALLTLDAARDRVRASASLASGRLEIVCAPTAVIDPLVPALAKVYRTHLGIKATVHGPFTKGRPLDVLRAGRAEVAVTYEREAEGCSVHFAGTQDMLVVLPPGAPVPGTDSIPLAELLDVGLVMSPPGDLLRDSLAHHLGSARVDAAVGVESAHPDSILLLVAAGAGATLLPHGHALIAATRLGLKICSTEPALRHPVYVAHRPEPLSPAARTLLEALRINDGPPGQRVESRG